MRKTVFVHIGAPAAGATFLQYQLRANRETMRAAGVEVLDPLSGGHGEHWEAVDAAVRATECPNVVMSDERLAGAATDHVARCLGMLTDHEVHIVYLASDFGDALIAEWQCDVLRSSREITLAAWIDEVVLGEHPAFRRAHVLSDVFGRWAVPSSQVHVVIAPPRLDDADALWKQIASVIGAPSDTAVGTRRWSGALGVEEFELLRRVREWWSARPGEGPRPLERDELMRDELVRTLLSQRSDQRPVRLPPEHRSWIEKHVAMQREFLADSGFTVVGDPNDLELDQAHFDEHVASPDETRMVEIGIDAISELVERMTARVASRERVERDAARAAPAPGSVRLFMRRTRRVLTSRSAAGYAIRRRAYAAYSDRARRTYFLHIGAPKTGSSYLQSLLWRSRHELMRSGVYLPGHSQTDHFHAGTDFRGRPYVTQGPDDDRWRGAWDRMVDDAERSGCPKIVITSEFLADSHADEIAAKLERLDGAEVHVIYAVRDFAGLLASEWQQGLKTSPLPTWQEWLEDTAQRGVTGGLWRRHDVRAVCERWTVRAVDQLHVLVLPRPGGPPDELWRRFQSIVGWTARTRVGEPRANESLGYSQAELLRRLQHRIADAEPRHVRARITKDLIADRTLGTMERVDSVLIPDHLRAWVESESRKRRDYIANSDAHVVGDVDELRDSESKFTPTPVCASEEVMLDAAVRVIARLTQRLAREDATWT